MEGLQNNWLEMLPDCCGQDGWGGGLLNSSLRGCM